MVCQRIKPPSGENVIGAAPFPCLMPPVGGSAARAGVEAGVAVCEYNIHSASHVYVFVIPLAGYVLG